MGTPCIPDDITGNFFGPLKQFEGVGWDGTRDKSHTKQYSVRCNICKNDPELFGEAIYKTTRSKLMKGAGLPCGCSKNPSWTQDQWKLRVTRACTDNGFRIVEYNFIINARARVTLECRQDGHVWSPEMRFVIEGVGCPECQRRNKMKPDKDMIQSFLESKKFIEGTKFWRNIERESGNGHKIFWNYTCPACSDDKFVKAGLCSGVFTSQYGALQKGGRSCRCENTRWTKEQREFTVKEIIAEENLHYSFLGWKGECNGLVGDKVVLECRDHGVFYPNINNFVNNGRRCPSCSNHGFDPFLPSVFYVIETEKFTGYGITRDAKTRMTSHKNSLSKYGLSIVSSKLYAMSGREALNLETAVRRNFELTPQPIVGFMKEATHLFSLADVNSFAEEWQASLKHVEQHENHTHDDILEYCSPT